VPREWIERYRGRFDTGWDAYRESVFQRQKEIGLIPPNAKLPPRDPDVPVWDSLPAPVQRVSARMMEVFAGFLSHADHHFGRILDALERVGELDNTLAMVISDNGASPEGGPHGSINENLFFNNVPERVEDNLARMDQLGSPATYNHYPWGWTWAGDTPFRRWKREVYRGGSTDPCVVSWPKAITARGEIRHQYAHAIDFVPTVLDALHVDPPKQIRGVTQSPIEGVSFAHTFAAADAPTRHHTQYFEMFGARAIDHDGWRAVCAWPGPTFTEAAQKGRRFGAPISAATLVDLDATGWELYHVAEDPTESTNLAGEHRDKLIELIGRWYVEAGKYKVLPLDGSGVQRMAVPRPQIARPRARYTYYPGGSAVPAPVAPVILNRPHSIEADVEIPSAGAEGVLLAQGAGEGGYTFFVKDGRLRYAHNYVSLENFEVTADSELPSGRHRLRFQFEPTGAPDIAGGKGAPGRFQLFVDGKLVGSREVPHTTPLTFIEGLSCGYDSGGSVLPEAYDPPFAFTGTIFDVVVDVSGELIEDEESTLQMMMAQQ
ncbi:MAG: sulfatase-like hydrolase/transferase, partial [Candidatus Dormibacteraeota bacterium]|nr:sulfatase-like hydrolase/transferase [Candidatus Dormibacteraeota bacterium]